MTGTTSERDLTSSLFKIEPLWETNWMPWRMRIEALLEEKDLLGYVNGTNMIPTAIDDSTSEVAKVQKWKGDKKAQVVLKLTISDSEMVHILGAKTAADMWKQLELVKQNRGRQGINALRHRFLHIQASDDTNIIFHIAELRKIQAELHLMGSIIADDDFSSTLVASLPESWDSFTAAYQGAHSNTATITSHELAAIIIEEYRRRNDKSGSTEVAMFMKGPKNRGKRPIGRGRDGRKCFNCQKEGHVKADCWAEGGGKAGQRPNRGRPMQRRDWANQAENDVRDNAYQANPHFSHQFQREHWLANSGATSHITPIREVFDTFEPISAHPILGLGDHPIQAEGRGTLTLNFNFKGQTIPHKLKDVLYAPGAINSLYSVSRFDTGGGGVEFRGGECILRNSTGELVGKGQKINRLYLLDATTKGSRSERANLGAENTSTWDEWHL